MENLFEWVEDIGNGNYFGLAKGHISQMWLWEVFIKGSIVLINCNRSEERWPSLKCHMVELMIQLWAKVDVKELSEWSSLVLIATGTFCSWYRPELSSASPIIFELWRFCYIHLDWTKKIQLDYL